MKTVRSLSTLLVGFIAVILISCTSPVNFLMYAQVPEGEAVDYVQFRVSSGFDADNPVVVDQSDNIDGPAVLGVPYPGAFSIDCDLSSVEAGDAVSVTCSFDCPTSIDETGRDFAVQALFYSGATPVYFLNGVDVRLREDPALGLVVDLANFVPTGPLTVDACRGAALLVPLAPGDLDGDLSAIAFQDAVTPGTSIASFGGVTFDLPDSAPPGSRVANAQATAALFQFHTTVLGQQMGGVMQVLLPSPAGVQSTTWGGVKALYHAH